MKPYPAPKGFVARALPAGFGWFRPKIEKPVRSIWRQGGDRLRLSEIARRSPGSQSYSGRVPVYSAPFGAAGFLVVRPCVHGGWWGRIARDLYLSPARVLREIHATHRLGRLKIPAPQVEAVLFYPAGPLVRIEVVTRQVPESQDLVRRLRTRPRAGERARIFAAVRKLLGQLHRHGIRHPDLNARNILLSPAGGGTAWVLDVDAVRFENPNSASVAAANHNRLLRSLLKRARTGDLGWSEAEVAKLWKELGHRS